MARAKWWHVLQGSKKEALLAVDLYNGSGDNRRLEAFVVHMQIAWTYLLHAKLERDKTDYWYRDAKTNRRIRIDGDFKTFELARCIKQAYPNQEHPVRRNVEFFIGFRNKIEHRYETLLESVVAGKCQSLIMNYERLLVEIFGAKEGLAERLRFPVFLSSLSDEAVEALKETHKRLPKRLTKYVDEYDAMLADDVRSDYRYDFRVLLIPQTGPRTDTDVAMRFVRLEDLPEEQRGQLEEVRTIVRERQVPVSNIDRHRPGAVCAKVSETLGVRFTPSSDHVRAWKYYGVRPESGAANQTRTDGRFCVWDEAHGDYVYTNAWIRKLATELADREKFSEVIGHDPIPLPDTQTDLAPIHGTHDRSPNDAAAA
jgi:hypothetical protein